MTMQQTKEQAIGYWESVAVELRPSSTKNADGTLNPFYLTRRFRLYADNRFELTIISYADALGKIPLAELQIDGHISWHGDHPLITGAQKVDFEADADYRVKPLADAFAGILNQYTRGYAHWTTGQEQSIFKKQFAPFGLSEGHIFKEYDLIYIAHGLMFWGARHVDGRGFDTEENRPTNLQVPMKKVI